MTDEDERVRVKAFRARLHDRVDPVAIYVGSVTVGALALLAASWVRFGIEPIDGRWAGLIILLAVLLWTEMRPILMARAGGVDSVVASMTFAFAVFLMFGVVPAMVASAVASAIADLSSRKPTIKVVFNAGQYCVAWGVAAFVFAAIANHPPGLGDGGLTPRWYAALLGAGVTYVLVNNVLVGVAVGLSQGGRVAGSVWRSITSEWSSDAVLLGLTPIVVIVMEESVVALPLLVLPILAVYRSVSISAEKEHLALHDSLTGLPNRFNFATSLDACAERRGGGVKSAVMLFDLDHFKEINDTLGHQAGDALLRMIEPRITRVLPLGSMVGRLGGDEFAVLVPALSDDHEASALARGIASELEEPFTLEGFNIEVKASIGIAIHPEDGRNSDELIKNADIAMYVAKSRGTVVERYESETDTHSTRRLEMVAEMRSAIADGDMPLYFQPKLDLVAGRVVEVEALVRWEHPRLGMIAPSEFVPLAEHTGLIRPLTSHVLNEAVGEIVRRRAAGAPLVVAVNLSVRGLHDGFILEEVSDVLRAGDVPPELLRFEITEGSIMADPVGAMQVLESLAEMGVRLSVDDFGTGYSSLAYLKDLPVDEIKIDRSFVTNLLDSEGDRVIVRSIIDLARNLGLTSVAEGVESVAALHWLSRAGCDLAQGYRVGRPMTSTAFDEWLQVFDASELMRMDGGAASGAGDAGGATAAVSTSSAGTRC